MTQVGGLRNKLFKPSLASLGRKYTSDCVVETPFHRRVRPPLRHVLTVMAKKRGSSYYAVKIGRERGIYTTV